METIINTGVKISEKHYKWVKKNAINLSAFLRLKLDEAMDEEQIEKDMNKKFD